MMHMSDIGGMSEGSMVVQASDDVSEGMLLPPMKLVENGEIRNDIWQMILGNCRHASTMSLDLKGLMAANMRRHGRPREARAPLWRRDAAPRDGRPDSTAPRTACASA